MVDAQNVHDLGLVVNMVDHSVRVMTKLAEFQCKLSLFLYDGKSSWHHSEVGDERFQSIQPAARCIWL